MHYEPLLPPVFLWGMALISMAVLGLLAVRRGADPFEKIVGVLRTAALAGLILVIGLRPMTERSSMDVETKNLDVLFVVDDTLSMWARDYNGKDTRMSGVRKDCAYIMEQLHGANFGLIRYENTARILAPFTQDRDNVLDALSTIEMPDSYYARGTALDVPYSAMEELLISSSKKEDRQAILFFFSDGEVTEDDAVFSYRELAQYVDDGAILGYGTEQGGRMRDNYGTEVYDYEKHEAAVSRIDEMNLKLMADDLGISYIHMERPENIKYLTDSILAGSSAARGSKRSVIYEDTYYYYAWPVLIVLALELILLMRRGRVL